MGPRFSQKRARTIAPILLLIGLFCSCPEAAENSSGLSVQGVERARVPNTADISDGVDVVLLLDCSGKMKQIDPRDYRKPAAKLFISLLGEKDSVSIIGFGDTAREIAPLTLNTPQNRQKLFQGIDNITAKEFNTNLTEAVEKGFEKLKTSVRKNRVIVLLSDGKLDLGSAAGNDASYQALKQLLPEVQNAGIKIHTIAFSDFAEMGLLGEIALATNGTATLAKNDETLHVVFASLFEKIKSPDSIPLQGDGFLVDTNIQEVILLITKKPGTATSLTDPSKQTHSLKKHDTSMAWYESPAFDMITIIGPAQGNWKIQLSSKEGNRIFVVTDLKLRTFSDRDFGVVGDKIHIDAWLEKAGDVIKDSAFLQQVTVRAEIATPERKSIVLDLEQKGKTQPNAETTGIYGADMGIGMPGDYRITIKAEGRTFQREKTYQLRAFSSVAETPDQARAASGTTPAKQSAIDWKTVLITFGSVNLIVVSLCGLLFLVCKTCRKRIMQVFGKEKKKPEPAPSQEKKK